MASIFTHAATGLAFAHIYAARPLPWRFWVLAALCPVLPDADVIGFRLGISYDDPLGHRGFSHSLLFAWLLGMAVVTIAFRNERFTARWYWHWVFFCLVTASHGVLDAFTNGGLGVGFFIPFTETRYFFPWTPIEVSPLTMREFFSSWGTTVILNELLWVWLPLAVAMAAATMWRHRPASR